MCYVPYVSSPYDTSLYVTSPYVSSTYDTSQYVTSPYVSSPYDTSLYVISRRFYIPARFIPEVRGPYSFFLSFFIFGPWAMVFKRIICTLMGKYFTTCNYSFEYGELVRPLSPPPYKPSTSSQAREVRMSSFTPSRPASSWSCSCPRFMASWVCWEPLGPPANLGKCFRGGPHLSCVTHGGRQRPQCCQKPFVAGW